MVSVIMCWNRYGGGIALWLSERVGGISVQTHPPVLSSSSLSSPPKHVVVMKPLLKIMRRVGEASASIGSPLAARGSWAFFGRGHADNAAMSAQAQNVIRRLELKSSELRDATLLSPQPAVWWVDVALEQAALLAITPLRVHVPLGNEGDAAADEQICATAVAMQQKTDSDSESTKLLWSQRFDAGRSESRLESSHDEEGRKELVVDLGKHLVAVGPNDGAHVRLWVTAASC